MMNAPYIKVEGVEKRFGSKTILENISFQVKKGEILSIIGPNGAGKSMLVKIILGLIEPTEGKVEIEGKAPKEKRALMGYVPQNFSFNRQIPMTVEEFWKISAPDKKSGTYFKEAGLEHVKDSQLKELSGGELQRFMIARALGTEKKIIILDEPEAGVDIQGQKTLYELIHQMNRDGATIIIVSHELEVVFRHATSVLCLNKRALCHGAPEGAINEEVLRELYGEHAGYYHHTEEHRK